MTLNTAWFLEQDALVVVFKVFMHNQNRRIRQEIQVSDVQLTNL